MKRNGANIFDEDECCCNEMWSSDGHFLVAYDVQKSQQADQDAENILSLYKQMKLQTQLEKTKGLDDAIKKDLLYTNTRMLSDISQTIQQNNYNYPKTYQNLTNTSNSNQILWNIQNKAIHLNYDPFGNQPDKSSEGYV